MIAWIQKKPPAGAKAKRAGRFEGTIILVGSGDAPLLVSDITAPVHEEMSGCVAGDRLGSAGRSLLSATIDNLLNAESSRVLHTFFEVCLSKVQADPVQCTGYKG